MHILYSKSITCQRAGGKIETNEMGRACSAYGVEDGRTQDFGEET